MAKWPPRSARPAFPHEGESVEHVIRIRRGPQTRLRARVRQRSFSVPGVARGWRRARRPGSPARVRARLSVRPHRTRDAGSFPAPRARPAHAPAALGGGSASCPFESVARSTQKCKRSQTEPVEAMRACACGLRPGACVGLRRARRAGGVRVRVSEGPKSVRAYRLRVRLGLARRGAEPARARPAVALLAGSPRPAPTSA